MAVTLSPLPAWAPNRSRYRANRPLRIEPVRPAGEQWRAVIGYEGLYEVSDRGAVRSVLRHVVDSLGVSRTFRSVVLRSKNEGNPGYGMVSLYRDGVRRMARVHVLVAAAFIGPRPPGMEVAHCDGDPSHACASNLRYATPSSNQADRVEHGTSNRGERHPHVVLSSREVLAIDRRLQAGALQRVVAAEFGVTRPTISAIAVGRSWGHLTGRGTAAHA